MEEALEHVQRDPHDLAALRALAASVARPDDLSALLAAVEARASVASGDEPWRLFLGVAQRALELGRTELAQDAATRAAEVAPMEFARLRFLSEACAAEGFALAAARASERSADTDEADSAARDAALRMAAEMYSEQGANAAEVRTLSALGARSTEHRGWALERLESLGERDGWKPELLEGVEAVARATDDAEVRARAHGLRWEHGERNTGTFRALVGSGRTPDEALERWESALADAPGLASYAGSVADEHAAMTTEREARARWVDAALVAHECAGDEAALAETLQRAVAAEDGAAASARGLRLGEVWLALGQHRAAADALVAAVESDASVVGAARERMEEWSLEHASPVWAAALARLAELVGDWGALHDVLLQRAESAERPAGRAEPLLELAALHRRRLGRPALAVQRYGEVLGIEELPESARACAMDGLRELLEEPDAALGAARALLGFAEEDGDDGLRARCLHVMALEAPTAERCGRWIALAEVGERLNDEVMRREALLQAAETFGGASIGDDAAESFQEMARRSGDAPLLRAALEAIADGQEETPLGQAALRDLLEGALDRDDTDAARAFAARLDEGEAATSLRLRVARAGGDQGAYLAAIQRALDAASEEERVALLEERFSVAQQAGLDVPEALEAALGLLEESPHAMEAIAWLESLDDPASLERRAGAIAEAYESSDAPTEAWPRVADWLGAAGLMVEAERWWSRIAGDPRFSDEARAAAVRTAFELALRRGDLEALKRIVASAAAPVALAEEALDRILDAEGLGEATSWSAVAAEYESAYLWDRRAQLLVRGGDQVGALAALEAWRDAAGPSALPLDRLAQHAALSVALADMPSGALGQLVVDILREDPLQPEVLEAIEGTSADIRDAVGSTWAAAIFEQTDCGEDSVDLEPLRVVGRWLQSGAHPSVALDAWQRVLRAEPTDAEADVAARGLATSAGELEAMLQARSAYAEDGAKIAILFELADLAEDAETREARLLEVLDVDLGDTRARLQLVDGYEEEERWQDAIALLEEVASLTTEPDERAAAWRRVESIALKSGDEACARRALEELLLLTPDDVAARARLESAYADAEEHDAVASMLIRRADREEDADERIRLLKDAARLFEVEVGDPARAAQTLERVLELEPANLPVLEELARLYEGSEAWDALLGALERIAKHAPIADIRTEVNLRAGRVLHHHLQRPDDALELMVHAAASTELTDDDLDWMRDAAESSGAWDVWVRAAERTLQRRDGAHGDALLLRSARVELEQRENPGRALKLLVTSLLARPGVGERLALAEEIAGKASMGTQLVDVYKAILESPDDNEAMWHAIERSVAIAVGFGQAQMAFDIMRRALAEDELRSRAEECMRALASEHSLWDAWASHLEELAENENDDVALAALLERAEVASAQQDDPRGALEHLLSAFAIRPFDPDVTRSLHEAASASDAWALVLRGFEVFRAEADDAEQRRYLVAMSEIAEEHLGDPSQAFAQYVRAWQGAVDDDELLAGLDALATRLDRRGELLAAWEWRAKQAFGDGAERAEWALTVADLAQSLGETERCLSALKLGAEDNGNHVLHLASHAAELVEQDEPGLTDWLNSLASAAEDTEATRLWELALQTTTDPVTRTELLRILSQHEPTAERVSDYASALMKAGQVNALIELRLGEPGGDWTDVFDELWSVAVDGSQRERVLEAALERDPNSPTWLRRLAEEARERESWSELVRALEQLSRGEDDAASVELADVYVDELGDTQAAVRTLDEALERAPSAALLERKARLLGDLERWDDHVAALETLADLCESAAAARWLGEAAEVAELQCVDLAKATALWESAAERDADYGEAGVALARLRDEQGDAVAASEAWAHALDVLRRDPEGVAALSRALHAFAARSEGDERIGALREALDLNPRDADARALLLAEMRESDDLDGLIQVLDDALRQVDAAGDKVRLLLERSAALMGDSARIPEAVKTMERARSIDATARGLKAAEGDVHLLAERYEEAAATFREALGPEEAVDPTTTPQPRPLFEAEVTAHPDVVYASRAGLACEGCGRVREAQDWFAAANLEDERYPPALLGLARLAARRGTVDAAMLYITEFFDGPYAAREEIAEPFVRLRDELSAQGAV